MRQRSQLTLAVCALALSAWLAPGCAPKAEETSEKATDSLTTSTTPAPAPAESAKSADPATLGTLPVAPKPAPDHIEVQHVLIGFQGSVPGKTVTRTKEEAEKLANEVLDKARHGAAMDELVTKYTDDQFPGVYDLANNGVTPDKAKQEYPRSGMVKGFSDAAFGLSVGNVGISNYDPKTSPFGWHIIKRLK
jgi:parvulin-like peptidyl-prolyl cis-trans isomerase-like protein